MRTCGRPAVPSTRASPRETKSSFVVLLAPYWAPGESTSRGVAAADELSAAPPSSDERLKPYLPSTHTVITKAPRMSSEALMICT